MSIEVSKPDTVEVKSVKAPNTLVMLSAIILILSVLTYIVPAGVFERVVDAETGRTIVVADSYHVVESSPVSVFDVFKAIPKGMGEAGYIIFFLFIIGGAFRILQATGAVDSGIKALVGKLQGKETNLIPVIMIVFALGGAVLGVAEEALAFLPMIVMLSIALGFDSLTGVAIVLIGSAVGYAGAVLNPFTVGVAQGIAGLPLFSGIEYRMICLVIFTFVSIVYVHRYAKKIKDNPELSPMYHEDKNLNLHTGSAESQEFTIKHKMVLGLLVVGVAFIAYGVLKLGFYITELGAIFLIIGIVSGLAGGLSISDIADEFVSGAKGLLYAGLIVGFARAMLVVMTQGNILDTVINSAGQIIGSLPPSISAIGMFIVQSLMNIIIPSGSGQAAVSIPIMAPLADAVGVSRQTAVLAYQFGDAFSNILTPTSGFFIAGISMCGISWQKWAKWLLPLFGIWCIVASVLLYTSVLIDYGPF